MPPCPPGAHFGTAGSPRALFAVPFGSAAGSRMSSEQSQAPEPLLAAGLLRGSAAARVLSPAGPPCVLPGFAQPARSRHALAGDAFCSVRGISSRARSPRGAELCLSGRLSSRNEASLRVLAGGLAAAAGGEAAGEEARPRRAARAALQRPGVAQHVVPGACPLAVPQPSSPRRGRFEAFRASASSGCGPHVGVFPLGRVAAVSWHCGFPPACLIDLCLTGKFV